MKRYILAGAAAAGMILVAGCSSIIPADLKPVTPDQVNAKVEAVRSYTRTACKFVPLFSTAAAIVNKSLGDSVDAIGTGICNALGTAPLADGPGKTVPMYKGVELRGKRV